MFDSDSSDDDIFRPNGFVDVDQDLVNLDFGLNETESSGPKPKKRRRKSPLEESVNDSPNPHVVPYKSAPVVEESVYVVEDEVSLEDICERVNRKAKKSAPNSLGVKTRKSRRIAARNSPITVDLNESSNMGLSPKASPKNDFETSVTLQCSLLGDMEEETLTSDQEDPNIEVSVRVVWKGCNTQHFTLRKFQKIKEIYTHYAQLEGVPEEQILFTLRDKPVTPNDTPFFLNIGVSSLEGGVIDVANVASSTLQAADEEDPNSLKLFIQRKGCKDRHIVHIYPHEKISVLISKVSEDLKIKSNLIKLRFDGEILDPNSTPETYDIEGEEVIDLIITE